MQVTDGSYENMGYQQLTVSTTAVALTVPAGARLALLRVAVAANGIRYRDDGTNPTAAVGFPIDSITPFWYSGELSEFKAIRKDAADAVLEVLYYR